MEFFLHVDLTRGELRREPVPEPYRHLGGRALTSRLVADLVDPLCDPLGPRNVLVFAPGLLAGTPLSSSSRISAGAKSPLTGGIKESNAGGQTGARLVQAGIKAIILHGQAPEWQVLVVGPDLAELRPAGDLVGQNNYAVSKQLIAEHGPRTAVATIGRPGEMLMNLAGIGNTDPEGRPGRICARGGLGAVMGSKRLKAIVALAGGKAPEASDPATWKSCGSTYTKELRTQPATAERYPQYGTAGTLELVHRLGGLPIRNFSVGHDPLAENITGARMREMILERGGEGKTTHSCMTGCAIQCSNVWADDKGKEVASSMEFETNTLLGSNLGIFDFDAIARFTAACNDLGIDTIETGGALGVAMAAGLLPFGDVAGVLRLLQEIGDGTVTGRLLGAGAVTVGKVLGVRQVAAVKGQTMAAYDPRVIKGNGVTYATSPMGADHTAGNTIGAKTDHLDPLDKVAISREWQLAATILDILGFCSFARGVLMSQSGAFAGLVSARLGEEWTQVELKQLALETIRLEVAFNRQAGLGPETDRVPEWMMEEALAPHNSVFDVPNEAMATIWDADVTA